VVVVAPEDVLVGKRLELSQCSRPANLARYYKSKKLKPASSLGLKLLIVELQRADYAGAISIMAAEKENALFVLAGPS
jgi:hypothetical protein